MHPIRLRRGEGASALETLDYLWPTEADTPRQRPTTSDPVGSTASTRDAPICDRSVDLHFLSNQNDYGSKGLHCKRGGCSGETD